MNNLIPTIQEIKKFAIANNITILEAIAYFEFAENWRFNRS